VTFGDQVDVVVAGGGPAGAVAASVLARAGFGTLLVESSDGLEARVGETLLGGAQRALVELGAWKRFLQSGHGPAYAVRNVWGEDEPYEVTSIANPYGPGWHLDRRAFDGMLRALAVEAGADLRTRTQLCSAVRVAEGWDVDLSRLGEGGEASAAYRVRTRFLIDATGRAATLGKRLGAHRRRIDRLVAQVQLFETLPGMPPEPVTLIEAAPGGWHYSAPLPGQKLIHAYMTDADLLRKREGGAVHGPRTRARIDGLRTIQDVRVVPAYSALTCPPGGRNWLAVGDAAAAFDPLSAQGLLFALQSAMNGARAAIAQLRGGPGAVADYNAVVAAVFTRYREERAQQYGRERRWAAAAFWARRHASGDAVPGPIHIIKNNRPRYVVMTEDYYARLKQRPSLWELLDRPAQGKRAKKEIDGQLRAERDAWDVS
jgi:flavin-dependent dehydrogenase